MPGSIGTTGGRHHPGQFAATYCTAPLANACTAQIDSGKYKTVYPYIETYLKPNTTVAGGSNVTLPDGHRPVHRHGRWEPWSRSTSPSSSSPPRDL